MEKITPKIESCFYEKLDLYQRLNQLLTNERQAIVNIDVETLWKNSDKKKDMAEKIQTIRRKLLDLVHKAYGVNDMDTRSFSMSYFIRTIPLPQDEKQRLRRIKLAIDKEKNQLAQAAIDNKKYVNEYLSVIDEIMAAAVDSSANAQYTNHGTVPGSKTQRCLIHAEV